MQLLNKYNENFQKALAQLNQNQLKAVNQLDGPVLVIAGPGTGKTQILAARIGKILLDTDTQPHNILCLTYTDAGAIAMRKRLFEFIGPEAYRVNIYTFHAFCNDIIQENLDYFGKLELDAISDLERIELFKNLVDGFGKDHMLKRFRGEVYYEIKRLQHLFSAMKREDWTPGYISQKIDEFLALIEHAEPGTAYHKTYRYQKNGKGYQAGSWKPQYGELKENLEKLRAAANEFPNYRELMRKMGRYDFDDMILWILEAFKKDENFLLNYQERYQYVLVDEYQDTSGAQNELIQLLISYWDKPNIFVVGDDDQSIFRFQGANVQNIHAYYSLYEKDLYQVMLTDNYRSSQHILDTARVLIENNQERVQLPGLSKQLIAKNEAYTNYIVKPQIRAYSSQFHEFTHITFQIEELIADGVAPQEIAVIYKEHRSGQELARYFQLRGIPVSAKKKVNILKEPFGRKIINLLRYIALENEFSYSGDELLFEIMHYDFYDIAPIDIARISVEVNDFNRSGAGKTSIRNKIYEIARSDEQVPLSSPSQKQIKRLSDDFEYWIRETHNLTLHHLFEKMMVRGGILAYVLKSTDETWFMQVLTSLFNFLKEESRKKPDLSLKEFVELLNLLEENDLPLELNQSVFNEAGVNFLTCHGSKGLEFDHVFLIGNTKNVWEGKRKNNSGQYKLPDTVFSSLPNASDEEELRRLFYVALTRARKQLFISYAEESESGKPLESTVFIGEILAATELTVQHMQLGQDSLSNFFVLQFKESEKPDLGLIDGPFIDHLLDKYTLSVTHLNNYLDCPLKFYFQNLVQVPCGKNDTMTFGSAVHWALNKLFRKLPDNQNEFHDLKQFMSDFQWYMNRNREAFTSEQFKRRMEYGEKILPPYYNQYLASWVKTSLTEYKIKNVEIDGVPVTGSLDKVELSGKQVNIVDYKTGNYENAAKKLNGPTEKDPLGGDYWRQAVFYKLMVENDRRMAWEVQSVEFDFVEPVKDRYIKEKIVIMPEHLKVVRNQIKEVYSRIKNHDFSGCGKEDCSWCTFVRSNFRQPHDLLEQATAEENED
ncbi:MAG: ATP-dependent DNA helicase [Sphingobacteriaceae bacterium]